MKSFVYVTGNAKKLKQVQEIVSFPVESVDVDLDEIQSLDVRAVSRHKAEQAYKRLSRPVLVEDTSLQIHSLNGLPGPLVKWFLKSLSHQDIASLVKNEDRSATYINCYTFFDGVDIRIFEGSIKGHIVKIPRGKGGMGFDPIFVHDGFKKTRAEMSDHERNEFSGRAIALRKFEDFLQENAKHS